MITRIISALIALPLAIALIEIGGWPFVALVTVVAGICAFEVMAMALPNDRVGQVVLAVLGMAIIPLSATGRLATTATMGGGALGLIAIMLFFLFRPGKMSDVAGRLGLSIAGLLWTAGLLASLVYLRRLPQGKIWIYIACVLAWGSDTGAYFSGRFLGRHRLYERVSPKKTWEGSVGGALTAVAGAFIIQNAFDAPDIPPLHLAFLSFFGAALGQMGDLCESLLKRSTGVKDSGRIMPGHGGLFDRVDALVFTAPWLLGYATIVLSLKPEWI